MPIYEYSCAACKHQFEFLVIGKVEPTCPACSCRDLERLLSLPAIQSETTRDKSMRAARKRDSGRAKDRVQDQLQYEKSHDRHG